MRQGLTQAEVADLGKYVDKHVHVIGIDLVVGCDNTLRHTMAWLKAHYEPGQALEKVLAWIQEQGGYCDCEVMLNVVSRLCQIEEF